MNSSSSLFMCAIRFEGLGRKKVSCLGSLAHAIKHQESLFPSLLSSVKVIFNSLLSTFNSQLLANGPFLRQQGSNGGINSHYRGAANRGQNCRRDTLVYRLADNWNEWLGTALELLILQVLLSPDEALNPQMLMWCKDLKHWQLWCMVAQESWSKSHRIFTLQEAFGF